MTIPTPPSTGADAGPDAPSEGVLIRADNGDVVTFDATGLTLRLSDTVLADLRQRLALAPAVSQPAVEALGDIDAWALRLEGDWLRFTARLERDRPPRDYLRRSDGAGDIIAAGQGPLCAILGLGGARRAGFNEGPTAFSYHIVAPGDHIGAVGLEGTALAQPTDALQRLPHASRDALIADILLGWRYEALRALPLMLVRAETDAADSIAALGRGIAYVNFLTALDSLCAAARRLDKAARVLAVGLDFALEDQTSDSSTFARGLRDLMAQIEADMAARGLHRPVFLITAEAGTQQITRHPAMQAHWQLAWNHGSHRLAVSAPGYMFEQTEFARPTAAARLRMAEMDAHALAALDQRQPWLCPLPLLAESQGATVRVIVQAMADLVLDDAFSAGPSCGFAVVDAAGAIKIDGVALDPADPRAVILTCARAPAATGAVLRYAFGADAPSPDALPTNRGALRDTWHAPSRGGGAPLHRWALPAELPIHPGAGT